MKSMIINGQILTPLQMAWLRELLLLSILSDSEVIHTQNGNDVEVFYHYRRHAFLLLQLIDGDPDVYRAEGELAHNGIWLSDEPIVRMELKLLYGSHLPRDPLNNSVQLSFVLSMKVRMAVSSSVLYEDELLNIAKNKNLPIEEIGELQRIIFAKSQLSEKMRFGTNNISKTRKF